MANTFPDLTVRENLEMGGYIRRHGVHERIEELCELFPDLRKSLRRKAGALSGGQRSMLAMARGLMLDPEVMLLDEPSAGLSPLLQKALWEQIEAVAATGVGICVVEQNTRRSLRHADWGYVLVLGKNRLDGPAHELLHDQEVIDLYVGTNVVEGYRGLIKRSSKLRGEEVGKKNRFVSVRTMSSALALATLVGSGHDGRVQRQCGGFVGHRFLRRAVVLHRPVGQLWERASTKVPRSPRPRSMRRVVCSARSCRFLRVTRVVTRSKARRRCSSCSRAAGSRASSDRPPKRSTRSSRS